MEEEHYTINIVKIVKCKLKRLRIIQHMFYNIYFSRFIVLLFNFTLKNFAKSINCMTNDSDLSIKHLKNFLFHFHDELFILLSNWNNWVGIKERKLSQPLKS